MSSAVGMNLLPSPITTTTSVVTSPIPTPNETTDKNDIEIDDMKHDKNISNCHQMEDKPEESDTNHNSEQNDGTCL